MECTDFHRVLHAYLDGECDVNAMVAAEGHLAICPSCAADVAHFRALSNCLREIGKASAPATLQNRIEVMVRQDAKRLRGRRLLFSASGVLAALLLLGVGGYALGVVPHGGLDDDDVSEVSALQIRSLIPGHLLDLTSADVAQIAPWFAKQLAFTPQLGRINDPAYVLAGARVDYCDGQRVAVLVYRHGDHIANLVIYPAEKPGERPPETASSHGVNMCGWTSHGMQFFIASDVAVSDLATFPRLLQL